MKPSASDNTYAAGLMTLSMAAFTINDTFLKALSDEVPLSEALFLRGCMTSALIVWLAWQQGVLTLRIAAADRARIGLRAVAEAGAAFFFLTALFSMPIANATAVLQALPLTVALASALFMGERLGWRRMAAILVGLAGVMLILRPGPDGFTLHALSALLAVAAITARDLLTRGLSGQVPSVMVALVGSVGVTLLGAALGAADQWVWPSLRAWLQLSGSALFILAAYLLSIMVMRVGDIGFVAPFRYTGLIWALVLGLLVFGEWPDALTLLGAAIVAGTGIYTILRERALLARG
jgi:S-adenosylmethionine uptake transporter